MIIGQKSRKFARYYRCVLRKKSTGGGGGAWVFVASQLIIGKKVDKLLNIIGAFWEKISTLDITMLIIGQISRK